MLSVRAQPIDYDKIVELAKNMPHDRTRVVMSKSCARKLWDNHQVIYEVPKDDKTKFVVAGCIRDGWRYLSIREFYLRKRDGTWQPGRNGIMIPIKSPLYKDMVNDTPRFVEPLYGLLAAFPDAVKFLENMELYSPEHEMWLLPKVKVKEIDDEDQ